MLVLVLVLVLMPGRLDGRPAVEAFHGLERESWLLVASTHSQLDVACHALVIPACNARQERVDAGVNVHGSTNCDCGARPCF